jgi:hypothetical protein
MVKRRSPKVSRLKFNHTQPTPEQIEAFAEGGTQINQPDSNAIRDFKAMRVPFNQYEYEQMEAASTLSGRSKLNFMRYAMLKLAKELQEET